MFCWTTLTVRNLEESLEFYTKIVGLKINRNASPAEGIRIAFLGSEGTETELELIQRSGKEDFSYGQDISLGFTVDSLEEKMEELKDRGSGSVEGPFRPAPGISFFYTRDPDGVKVQFVENA